MSPIARTRCQDMLGEFFNNSPAISRPRSFDASVCRTEAARRNPFEPTVGSPPESPQPEARLRYSPDGRVLAVVFGTR